MDMARSQRSPKRPPGATKHKRAGKSAWVVEVGDWPDVLPVTEQELRIVETYLADTLSELLGPVPYGFQLPFPQLQAPDPSSTASKAANGEPAKEHQHHQHRGRSRRP